MSATVFAQAWRADPTRARELAAAAALVALGLLLLLVAPGFFAPANLRDLLLNNLALLVAASGMTLVIASGEVDISIGSQFGVLSILVGHLALAGYPHAVTAGIAVGFGAMLGGLNGLLVAKWRVPSIVATLATMVVLRETLRWTTGGEWVLDLPPGFQWLGLEQTVGQVVLIALAVGVVALVGWALQHLAAGRAVFAVGSSAEAARLAGLRPARVTAGVFVTMGLLVAIAALLNAVRFPQVPANAGLGLELEAIAAVVVGGASVTGGRASLRGTLVGVAIMGLVGTALTFLGVSPFWEKALQGGIILLAVAMEWMVRGETRP